jgi:tetratricopeptide (TPR) repeat protein
MTGWLVTFIGIVVVLIAVIGRAWAVYRKSSNKKHTAFIGLIVAALLAAIGLGGISYYVQYATPYDDRYEEASADPKETIELGDGDKYADHNRGRVYSDLKRYDEALDDYDKAIELDDEFAIAYYNRSLTFDELGKPERAIADRRKYEELTGNR